MQQNITLAIVLGTLAILMLISPILLFGGAFGSIEPLRGDKPEGLSELHDTGTLKAEGACAQIPEASPDRLYRTYIGNASIDSGVSPAFIAAVVKQESAFRADAVSSAGAMGAMQIMPATFAELELTYRKRFIQKYKPTTRVNAFNPQYSIYLGSHYLKYNFGLLHQRERTKYELTAAAYNAGAGAVQKYGYPENMPSPEYDETKNYVRLVLQYYNEFRACEDLIAPGTADHPNIRKLIGQVEANPGRYAQCTSTGCADTNAVLLRNVFPQKDPRGGPSLGQFPDRPRIAPPTYQDLERAKAELRRGNFPVWHINGEGRGQDWIILVRVKDKSIDFFDPANGQIRKGVEINYMASTQEGNFAYFGITSGAPNSFERGYVFKP